MRKATFLCGGLVILSVTSAHKSLLAEPATPLAFGSIGENGACSCPGTATLAASLQHATVPGPAVIWTFRFEQNADGTWKAVCHK